MLKCHIPNSKYEVIAAIGRRTGQRKKILVIAAYIPPSYTAEENKSCIEYLSDTITSLKNRYNDPHIFVGVDFNKRDINKTVKDYPNLRTVQTGPTRGNAVLDIIATSAHKIWSEWRLTVIAATVRIALVDILDLSEVDIPAGGFLYPAVGWG